MMNSKQTILALGVAGVLAMASPAHAGLLGGGAAGGLGGGFGGGFSGLGGGPGFAGRGGFSGMVAMPGPQSVKHRAADVGKGAQAVAEGTKGRVAEAVGSGQSVGGQLGNASESAGLSVAGHAVGTNPPSVGGDASAAGQATRAEPKPSPPTATKSAAPPRNETKPASTGMTGAEGQRLSAGPRTVYGNESGSFDAAHASGATSAEASANAAASAGGPAR